MSKKWFVSLTLLFFLVKSPAYIPSYSLILSHTAYFQGQGGYRIDQELFFKGPKSFSLKEIWWVKGPNFIRLHVLSKETGKVYFRFIYGKNKLWFKDEKGRLRSKLLSHYHLERPFHLRSAKELKKLFSLWKVAPFTWEDRNKQGSDPFVRLSRLGGETQYEIGFKNKKARLYVKQDEFVIRAWKWETGEHLSAWDYKLYPRRFFFPSKRLFRENSKEVEIQVKGVKSLPLTKKWFHKSVLKPNSLDQNLPTMVQKRINEFYRKFR